MIKSRIFLWILSVLVVISTFFSILPAHAFVLLPPDCRGKNEVGCLLLHRLDYIFIFGRIGDDDDDFFAKLDKLWPTNVPLPTVYVESRGGNVDAAMKIGRILRKRNGIVASGNPITMTDGYECTSSCVFIALGAPERHLKHIGVHQGRIVFNGCKPNETIIEDDEAAIKNTLDYFDDMGADPKLTEAYKNTPNSKVTDFYFDSEDDLNEQPIVQMGFHMAPSSRFPSKGFPRAKHSHDELNEADLFYFVLYNGNTAVIQDMVGSLLCESGGQKPDWNRAEEILKLGVERDDAASIYQLASFYEQGSIEQKDIQEAVPLYLKGAKLGHGQSQNAVGRLYYEGNGVPQDYRQAVYWFQEAAYNGHSEAFGSLCKVYMEAKAVTVNDFNRYTWCDLAGDKVQDETLRDYAKDAVYDIRKRMSDADIDLAKQAEVSFRVWDVRE